MQIGHHNTQTNVFVTAAPAVRSAYPHQVRAIAPPELLDRQPELAALAAFCTAPGDGGYLWWRAPAWAGKSALLAWFALHPPPGVRVVPFFVTGRFAGHGDRTGFTDVVLEQLAELLDRPLPAQLSEATRGPHLTALLTDAAALCRERGERLVLLVDGLDEDRGVVAGPDAHSIAALLPVRPPHGLRVVVAGRPDPPLPSDVPEGHPLRAEGVVRVLGMSPHAQVVRRDAERELKRLLHGSAAEQDLLGLVTASGGGLRAADLAELTGLDRWQVDEHLEAVTARTFTRRGGHGAAAPADAYLLAHEELQAAAVRFLAPRLGAYRERLRTWADAYRGRGWPPDTPDYLLRGYAAMLADSGEAAELFACATDRARHALLLSRTGGDAAALAEIGAAQDAVLAREVPDLAGLGVLAVHHGLLSARNLALPPALPAAWAVLGDLPRAQALAGSAPEAGTRAELLTDLVERAAGAGQPETAVGIAERVTATARGIENPWLREQALIRLAAVLAGAGHVDRATAVAATLAGAGQPHAALLKMAEALAHAGRDAQLRRLIASSPELEAREDAWQRVAQVWARQGRLTETERLAASLTTRARAFALESLADAQAGAGRHAEAEATALAADDPFVAQRALKTVACHLAEAGFHDRAEALVDRLTEPMLRTHGLEQLAEISATAAEGEDGGVAGALRARAARQWAAACGLADTERTAESRVRVWTGLVRNAAAEPAQALRLADRAEALARTLKGPYRTAHALGTLAVALVHAGAHARAEAVLGTLSGYNAQETARRMVEAAVRCGHHAWAETLVRSGETAGERDLLLHTLVRALREQGRRDRATAAARTLRSPRLRAEVLAELALAAGEAGERQTAAELAAEAERTARSSPDGEDEGRSLAALIRALTAAPADARDRPRIRLLARRTEAVAARLAEERPRGEVLSELVVALYLAGEHAATARALRSALPGTRAVAFTALVRAAGQGGRSGSARPPGYIEQTSRPGRAERPGHVGLFADAALAAVRSDGVDPESVPHLLSRLARALDEAGAADRAEALLGTVADPVARIYGWAGLVTTTAPEDRTRVTRLADLAEAAAFGVPPSNALDQALLGLAEALVEAGAHERAEAVARPLIHPYAPDIATSVRMRAAAARRDWAEIDRLAGTMRSRGGTLRTMTSLAVEAAGAGDTAGVREFLGLAWAQGVVLGEWEGLVGPVVGALVAAGEFEEAEALAERVPTPGEATRVRVALARALEPDRARPLLARALREGDWREAADALGGPWPAAARAMADTYLEGTA
ncbi:hypothetical protein ACH414_01940 [Streptomyces sp. NPDC020422]|uniref:hypothetical protein n=1 Tax=Streptomyces sp. NPDC020422 TaxID=3365074 RepID=UPI00379C320D